MKLRACFPRLQLLFIISCAFAPLIQTSSRADIVTTTDGRRQELKVLGVLNGALQVQIGAGTMGLPLPSIKDVQMAVPPELGRGLQAFAAKEYGKALILVRAVAEKYKGVPAEWAQQSTALLADLYLTVGELGKAEAAYKEFGRLYPGAGSLQIDVGMARIAASKKQFAEAKATLEPIAEAALKEKNVSRANAAAYSQVFLARGDIKEKEGDLPGALEDYIRTITLFYNDPAAVSAAQSRAEALTSQKVTVP